MLPSVNVNLVLANTLNLCAMADSAGSKPDAKSPAMPDIDGPPAEPPAAQQGDDNLLDDEEDPSKGGANGEDVDMDAAAGPAGVDGAADGPEPRPAPAIESETRVAQKKDATLREFISKMDDYAPIVSLAQSATLVVMITHAYKLPTQIPDAVVHHYLTLAGLPPPPQTPPALARLLALATQKFVADVAADSYQYARIRSSHTTGSSGSGNAGLPGQAPGAAGGVGATPGPGGAGGKDDKGGKNALGLGAQRPGFGGGGGSGGQGRTVLTMEDLGMAVGEYGVNVKRGEFYR